MDKPQSVRQILTSGEAIPPCYKDHPLKNNRGGYRDLHIEPDGILIYKVPGDTVILQAATGTHTLCKNKW